MSRQPGYKQVSLTAEAHRALQQMTYVISAEIADKVTLSQAVLIGQKLLSGNGTRIATAAREIGIEPNADAQNPGHGALCELGHKARPFAIDDEVVGALAGGRVMKVTKIAKIVNRDVYGQQEIQLNDVDIWHKGSDYVHVHRSPAYDAPLCTSGHRIDHEHSVACGPMAGECVTPGHVHVHPESTVRADNGCVTAQNPAHDAPGGTFPNHPQVRLALLDVQAEVDAYVTAEGHTRLPYTEVIEMVRRVATDRGIDLAGPAS